MQDCKSSSDAHIPYRKRKYMLSASGSSPETVVDKDPVIITSSSGDDKESHKKTASHPSMKIKCSNDPADDGDSGSDVSFSVWVDGRAAIDENASMGCARNEELKESDNNHETSQAEDDEVFSFHKQSNDDGLDKGHEQLDLLLANKFGGNENAAAGGEKDVNNGKEKTNHGGNISRRARGNDGATELAERTTQQPPRFRLFGRDIRF